MASFLFFGVLKTSYCALALRVFWMEQLKVLKNKKAD